MLKDKKGRLAISGKVDGFINLEGQRIPFEAKSWDFNMTRNMFTFGDVLQGKWTRSGAYQLLSYLYGSGLPFGLFILDRPGLPRLIPVNFYDHLTEMERFLSTAERILDHIEAETLPPFYDDPSVCKECPLFGSLCNPDLSYDGAQMIFDEEVIQLLQRREELKEGAKEYTQIDSYIKERFRGLEIAVAGSYLLKGKFGKGDRYTLLITNTNTTSK